MCHFLGADMGLATGVVIAGNSAELDSTAASGCVTGKGVIKPGTGGGVIFLSGDTPGNLRTSSSGNVARSLKSGSFDMNKGPFCPQPEISMEVHNSVATHAQRAWALTRIICFIPMVQIVMTDLEFLDHAEQLLKAVELACDDLNDNSDADIDNQRVGGMITLVFSNRSQIIINLQKPLHEVWLAAKSGGYHFRFDGSRWMDTKGQGEFFERLTQDACSQTGLPLRFTSQT
jgi:CyaY protein